MAMAQTSAIEWTEATWNPVTGCSEVSPGCAHCYAKTFAERWRGVPGHPYEQGFDLRLWPERSSPLRWRKPRTIFVNSMSDLFHEDIPSSSLSADLRDDARGALAHLPDPHQAPRPPAELADRLRLAAERLDGRHDREPPLRSPRRRAARRSPPRCASSAPSRCSARSEGLDLSGIDWLIAGGESGPRHRRVDPDWMRDAARRCGDEGVAFFFKQWGGASPKSNGRELDGRLWDDYPGAEGWPPDAISSLRLRRGRAK